MHTKFGIDPPTQEPYEEKDVHEDFEDFEDSEDSEDSEDFEYFED